MKLALAGINHRTAPVQLREKFAFPAQEIPSALLNIQARGAKEALILSTCNRVEITAALGNDVSVDQLLEAMVSERQGLTVESVRPHLYIHEESKAIRQPTNSSTSRTYLIACAGRSAHDLALAVGSFQPSTVS